SASRSCWRRSRVPATWRRRRVRPRASAPRSGRAPRPRWRAASGRRASRAASARAGAGGCRASRARPGRARTESRGCRGCRGRRSRASRGRPRPPPASRTASGGSSSGTSCEPCASRRHDTRGHVPCTRQTLVRSAWRRLGTGVLCLTLSECTPSRPHYKTRPPPRTRLRRRSRRSNRARPRTCVAYSGIHREEASMAGTKLPTQADVESYFKRLNNWGRWGHDDQRGTVNLITDARRAAARALVKTGRTVSLSREIVAQPHLQFMYHVTCPSKRERADVVLDRFDLVYHGCWITHVDAPCHGGCDDERPIGYAGFGMGVHLAIPFLGLALVDNTNPERLAKACAEEGRYEFLFTATPLRLVGATGAPAHPIAVF